MLWAQVLVLLFLAINIAVSISKDNLFDRLVYLLIDAILATVFYFAGAFSHIF